MNISRQVNLQPFNSLGIEVYADYFSQINNLQDLAAARCFCQQHGLPWLLIGGGSNLVLTDDFAGLVMLMAWQGRQLVTCAELHFPTQSAPHIGYWQVAAGENWDDFVAFSIEQQYFGLQNLSLIPGTVGAAPIQNIGAYGADIAQVLQEVQVYDFANDQVFYLTAADCQLAYRDSVFKRRTDWIVTQVTFALSCVPQVNVGYGDIAKHLQQVIKQAPDTASPQQVREAVIAIRQSKLPNPDDIPNVGSFFKNPIVTATQYRQLLQEWPQLVAYPQADGAYKLAAGWLIDQLGWKGHRANAVGVHENQALVLIREPHGTAGGKEIMQLAEAIKANVQQVFAVDLQVEPRVVGAQGKI